MMPSFIVGWAWIVRAIRWAVAPSVRATVGSARISVTGAPEGAKITYVSSDESIATVSSSGVLTAKGSGTTTVSDNMDENPAMT